MAEEDKSNEDLPDDGLKILSQNQLQTDLNRVLTTIRLAGFYLAPGQDGLFQVVDKLDGADLRSYELLIDSKAAIHSVMDEAIDLAEQLGYNIRIDRKIYPSGATSYTTEVWAQRNKEGGYD